jgi:hypothetical protein
VKTAQQAASNWSNSAGRAAADWETGVQGYTGDWAGATTRQQAVMQTNWTQSVTSGRWANGVNAIGTAGWKSRTVAKSSNYTTGFSAGAANQAAAAQKIQAALANIVPSLPARGTYEQNKTRSTTLMDSLHALKGSLGAR